MNKMNQGGRNFVEGYFNNPDFKIEVIKKKKDRLKEDFLENFTDLPGERILRHKSLMTYEQKKEYELQIPLHSPSGVTLSKTKEEIENLTNNSFIQNYRRKMKTFVIGNELYCY